MGTLLSTLIFCLNYFSNNSEATMNNDDALRFKVTISKKANPELHKYIEEAGPYYGSKRMLQLALLGMSITKGHQAIAMPPVTSTMQPTRNAGTTFESVPTKHNGYQIPEGASAAIGKMFEGLENFGMGYKDAD